MQDILGASALARSSSLSRLRIGASVSAVAVALIATPVMAQATPQTTPPPASSEQAPTGTAPTVVRPADQNTAQSSSPDGQGVPIEGPAGTTEQAQTTPTETVDDIVVTGYRQALQSAQQIKRNSDAIVDSVTAEDIGALPDRSVVETLQRIPGVTISRFAAGTDPDHFAVEGSGANVRGLTYVRSEFNGREAFSALGGRSLGFQDVPSELLGGVDVFKSPTADRIEGGISGIVNLRTRKPFDTNTTYLAATLENNYGDFVKKSAPTVSILGSTRFKTGLGEFGVLGSFVYSQLFTRNDRLQLSSFRTRPIYTDGTRTDVLPFTGATQQGSGLFPRGAVQGSQEFNRERYGYAGALQWRSNDGSMEAAFQFLRSDARQAWTENVIEIATDLVTDSGDSRARPGTSISFDENGIFDQGFITSPTGGRSDSGTAPIVNGSDGSVTINPAGRRTPAFGLSSNNQFREHLEKSITDDYGANFKWDVSDRFGLVLDYSHVESSADVIDNTIWGKTYQDAFIDVRGSDLPIVRFQAPLTCDAATAGAVNAAGNCTGAPGSSAAFPTYLQNGGSFTDPAANLWRNAMDHVEESEGNSDAFRIDGEFSFGDESFLKSIRAGYRYAERDQVTRNSAYNWGVLSEQWGNGGPVWLDEPIGGPGADQTGPNSQAGTYEPYFWSNFFRGQAEDPSQGQGRLYYNGRPAADYPGYIAFAKAIRNEWLAPTAVPTGGSTGWVPLAERPGVIRGTYYLPGEINPINEKNHAGYIMARFDRTFGNGMRFNGNIGVRYTDTKRTSRGFTQFPTTDPLTPDATCQNAIINIVNPVTGAPPTTPQTIQSGCAFLFSNPALRASARAFANAASVINDVETSYDYWLPSVNLKLEVGGGLQFRGAYFKGVSPPNTRDIRNNFPLNLGVRLPAGATLTVLPNTATADPNDGIISGEEQVLIEGSNVRAGAPGLLPVTSDNFDLTAEWYFNRVGSLTLSGFYKELRGVVVFNTQRQSFTNNGQTFDAITTQELNAPDTGKVKGFELAYQQTYDFLPGVLSGFGLQANYTFVDSSGVPQPALAANDPAISTSLISNVDISGFSLQGLSRHTFNVTPFYDYKGFSLRASYVWRSRFLLTYRDVITPNDPVFQEDYGQLDASVFMQVTPALRLGFQGVNLANAITKTSVAVQGPGGVSDIRIIPRGWFMNDRRISAVARFKF